MSVSDARGAALSPGWRSAWPRARVPAPPAEDPVTRPQTAGLLAGSRAEAAGATGPSHPYNLTTPNPTVNNYKTFFLFPLSLFSSTVQFISSINSEQRCNYCGRFNEIEFWWNILLAVVHKGNSCHENQKSHLLKQNVLSVLLPLETTRHQSWVYSLIYYLTERHKYKTCCACTRGSYTPLRANETNITGSIIFHWHWHYNCDAPSMWLQTTMHHFKIKYIKVFP